jgi:hypothetical protein
LTAAAVQHPEKEHPVKKLLTTLLVSGVLLSGGLVGCSESKPSAWTPGERLPPHMRAKEPQFKGNLPPRHRGSPR